MADSLFVFQWCIDCDKGVMRSIQPHPRGFVECVVDGKGGEAGSLIIRAFLLVPDKAQLYLTEMMGPEWGPNGKRVCHAGL
ncbi:unnamed protein product [Boreogadus saida]